MNTFVSDISGKSFPIEERANTGTIRDSILKVIKMDHPDFDKEHLLTIAELNFYREKYISNCMLDEQENLTKLESQVLDSIKNSETLSDKLKESDTTNLSFGDRLSDSVAEFGGTGGS
jgi:hypothetical protein